MPTTGPIGLGSAAQFAVLGLPGTQITNLAANVQGNEGVSKGGGLTSLFSTVGGGVSEAAKGQYLGVLSTKHGRVTVDSALLSLADADAQAASAQAAALTPTQTFSTIGLATTVTGNGGLNVIDITGSLQNSLTLQGGPTDVFVVNVTGNAGLFGGATLKLSGGVTADHVLYNFTGNGGSVTIVGGGTVDGTLLSPHENVTLGGTFNGAVVGGGRQVTLLPGARVNSVPFNPLAPPSPASLSGFVANAGVGISGVTVTLTGTDSQGNAVLLTATTDDTGAYSFTGLQPGTYTILASRDPSYRSSASVGLVNGTSGDGTVDRAGDSTSLILKADDVATHFDFSESLIEG